MLKYRALTFWSAAIAVFALAACKPDAATSPTAADPGDDAGYAALIDAAVGDPSRPAEDRADDPMRKPAEMLAFIGVKPGLTVFEIEAGRGYYTELFSAMVGPEGAVVMHSPPIFDRFLGEGIEDRLAEGRLPNVRLSKTYFDELDAEDASADIVTWLLGPHELYFVPAGVESLGDVETAYAEAMRILKPGGTFVILDHAAAPGSTATTWGSLHRVDPQEVKRLAAAAGFRLVEENDMMRNLNDKYDMNVFDPVVRRKTDRFLLKYEKPE